MFDKKRQENEQKFKNWKPADAGGRIYWHEVQGRHGWSAHYVKDLTKMKRL